MRTFDGWKNLGYYVNKGSKAIWVNGVPMFTKFQVTYKHRKISPSGPDEKEWDGISTQYDEEFLDFEDVGGNHF